MAGVTSQASDRCAAVTSSTAPQQALVRLDDEGNVVEWTCVQCGARTHSAKSMSVHWQTHTFQLGKISDKNKNETRSDAVEDSLEIGQGDGSRPPSGDSELAGTRQDEKSCVPVQNKGHGSRQLGEEFGQGEMDERNETRAQSRKLGQGEETRVPARELGQGEESRVPMHDMNPGEELCVGGRELGVESRVPSRDLGHGEVSRVAASELEQGGEPFVPSRDLGQGEVSRVRSRDSGQGEVSRVRSRDSGQGEVSRVPTRQLGQVEEARGPAREIGQGDGVHVWPKQQEEGQGYQQEGNGTCVTSAEPTTSTEFATEGHAQLNPSDRAREGQEEKCPEVIAVHVTDFGTSDAKIGDFKIKRRRKMTADMQYGLPVILSSNKKLRTDNKESKRGGAEVLQSGSRSGRAGSTTDLEQSRQARSVTSERSRTGQLNEGHPAENQDVGEAVSDAAFLEDTESFTNELKMTDVCAATTFQCSLCAWQTRRHFNYHRHLLSHSLGASTECTYCYKVIGMFVGKSDYGEKQHKCGKCVATFHRKAALHKHLQEEHGDTCSSKFVCFICLEAFEKIQSLKSHLGEAHPQELKDDPKLCAFQQDPHRITINEKGDELICSFCNWKSDRHFNYHRHVLRHCLSSQNYVCPYCCKHITPEHSASGYGVTTFTCTECSHVCYTKCHLSSHLYAEHGINQTGQLACAICNYRCGTKKHLMKHHEIAHEGQDFVLNEATLQALSNSPQQDANGNSPEVRDYTCDKCGFTCNRQDTLKKHAIIHVPEQQRKVFRCPEGDCGFETYSQISLNVHVSGKHKRQERALRRNELAVIYACDLCGHFNTPSEEQLFLHQASSCVRTVPDTSREAGKKDKVRAKKTRAPPGFCIKYSCNQCRKFLAARRWNMLRHKETAHGDSEALQCAYCAYSTRHRKLMVNHYTKAHLMELPEQDYESLLDTQEQQLPNDLRGVFTICPTKRTATKMKPSLTASALETCKECGESIPASQLRKHMVVVHQQLKAAAVLSSHVRRGRHTRRSLACVSGEVKAGAGYTCVWRCGHVTASHDAWHRHNREECRLRDHTKSWAEYEMLCQQQEGRVPDAQTPPLRQQVPGAGAQQDSDAMLSSAMRSITEITRAMRASGIEQPVVQQQGKTIYITIDKEDILKRRLKEQLLNLNKVTGDNRNSRQAPVHYIIKTTEEKTAEPQDIETSNKLPGAFVENSMTVETSQFVNNPLEGCTILDDIMKENPKNNNSTVLVQNPQILDVCLDVENSEIIKAEDHSQLVKVVENSQILQSMESTARTAQDGAVGDENIGKVSDRCEDRMETRLLNVEEMNEVMATTQETEVENSPSLVVEKGDSSWTVYSTDDKGETILYQIEGDFEMSNDGELAPEVQQLLAVAIDKPS